MNIKKTLANCFMFVYNNSKDVDLSKNIWSSVLNDD